MSLTIIVAATLTNGIGQGGRLPWRLPMEMAYFARVTKEAPPEHPNAVIMGRKTWESIPKSRRPLAGRVNLVITRDKNYDLSSSSSSLPSYIEPTLDDALARLSSPSSPVIHRLFMIGGASLYYESLALEKPSIVDRILLTRILSPAFNDCDVYFPNFKDTQGWTQASHNDLETWTGVQVPKGVQEENGVQYEFQMWVRHASTSSL